MSPIYLLRLMSMQTNFCTLGQRHSMKCDIHVISLKALYLKVALTYFYIKNGQRPLMAMRLLSFVNMKVLYCFGSIAYGFEVS